MRNLHVLRNCSISEASLNEYTTFYIVPETSSAKSTEIFAFDKYLALDRLITDDYITFKRDSILDLAQFVEDGPSKIKVVGCNHLFNQLFVILSNGLLVSIKIDLTNETTALSQPLSIGSVKCVAWSEDSEKTVVINSDDVLYVFAFVEDDAEYMVEISLQDETDEVNKFVNVGWGSAETQFRGSEGKYSKADSTKTASDVEETNDQSTTICWKPNSSAFAVSYFCRREQIRKIKIFTQDGVLLNATKNITGLRSPMDWCASNSLISCVQTLPNKRVVCFLEDNALRHGDFTLNDDGEVIELRWNTKGTILAVRSRYEKRETLSLWTTKNYKWYMKQFLEFDDPVTYLQWDLTVPNRLHVVMQSGLYRMWEWTFRPNIWTGHPINAVIDERLVLIANYDAAIEPSSVISNRFEFDRYINAVVFPEPYDEEMKLDSFLVYTSDNRIIFRNYRTKTAHECTIKWGSTNDEVGSPITFQSPLELSHLSWSSARTLCFVWSRPDGCYFCAADIEIADQCRVDVVKTFRTESSALSICVYETRVLIGLDNGKVLIYEGSKMVRYLAFSFAEPCVRMRMLDGCLLVALSENHNIYVNEFIQYRGVIDFEWKAPFFVAITMDHHLLITKVRPNTNAFSCEHLTRAIEPKSCLVNVVNDYVVLQMERGNLEVITPRPFAVHRMEQMLKVGQYRRTFDLFRKQRINTNVIFDHNPTAFINHVTELLSDPQRYLTADSVETGDATASQLLTLITELEDRNVARDMFPWRYRIAEEYPNKVKTVCETLTSNMNPLAVKKYLRPYVAALVRLNRLEKAASFAIDSNEIQFLLHMVDTDAVYRAALAANDVRTALKIIECSNVDPSEYVPFLRELQNTDEPYRKFRIHDYLEDYEKALSCLIDCEDGDAITEQCLEYIRQHNLYDSCVHLFESKVILPTYSKERHTKMALVVAQHCRDVGRFEEAAIVYETHECYEEAYECYAECGEWRAAVAMAQVTQHDPSWLRDKYVELYRQLHRMARYEDAACMAQYHLDDSVLAIESFVLARKFSQAINVALASGQKEQIATFIRSQATKEAQELMDILKDTVTMLKTYAQRLGVVRGLNSAVSLEVDDAATEDSQSECSSESGGSVQSSRFSSDSGTSRSSRRSRSSVASNAKRERRKQAKLWLWKEGGRREEPALLNMIREVIENTERVRFETIDDVFGGLLRCDEKLLARKLRDEYEKYCEFVEKICDEIWPPNVSAEGGYRDSLIRCPPSLGPRKCQIKL